MTPQSAPTSIAGQRVLAQLARRSAVLAEQVAVTAQLQIPTYAALSRDAITRNTETVISRVISALREAGELTASDLRTLEDYGEARARQGISLSDMQTAWRLATRMVLAELTATGRSYRAPDRLLLDLTHRLLDIVDEASIAYGAAHHDVEIEMTRRDQNIRSEFTRGTLLGTLSPAEIRMQAQHFGLPLVAEYRALRGDASAAQILRPHIRAGRCFLTTIDGDVAGFADKGIIVDSAPAIGFGPPTDLGGLTRSFRLASRILTTARAFAMTGPLDIDTVGLLPAVISESDLGAEFTRRYLGPLGSNDRAQTVIATIEQLIDNGMHIESTAEQLHAHPNTIRYRISRFEELTGANLRSPHTALRVWWAIKHLRASELR